MAQRFARELLGLLELARIAVDDRQVAVGHGAQVRVAGGVGQVQRLACGAHALAELPRLGQCDGLAAVLITRELDRVLPVEHRAFAGQRQQRVGVRKARLRHPVGRGLGIRAARWSSGRRRWW
ncbi:hypothetical protein D9M69_514200 [compost metagenome]